MRLAILCLTTLVLAPSAEAQMAAARLPICLACHGAAGTSASEGIPSLGGQPADYILVQLLMFREKQRLVEPMNAMAAGLTDDDLRTLGDAMSKLPPPATTAAPLDAAALQQGSDLVAKYRCGSCHNADLAGHDQIPRLAAQREDYLLKSLQDYKSNARPGYEPAMNEVAQEVKAADIPILAKYLAAKP